MKALADLHVHSSYSDGIMSPAELVSKAAEIGLGGIALTDHDTVDGIHEFMSAEPTSEVIRVPGIEISTEYDDQEVHILGYFVPYDAPRFRKRLLELEKARKTRFPKMIERLRKLGFDITDDDVNQALKGVTSPGRPHLARLLVMKGIAKDFNEAFEEWLLKGKPAYVRKERMDTVEAVKVLRDVGAVPVVAHPLTIEVSDLRGLFAELLDNGLLGVEIHYEYSILPVVGTMSVLRDAISGLGLIESGGTDFHGDDIGVSMGSVTVPVTVIDNLREMAGNEYLKEHA
ncbi:MAG: PHP domain-containing protein [Candidatus Thorarchaeota archaeon]|nr:MAG: PHP domain-containing protein [Candidatus Thorarchaeota archaeon]